MKKIEIIDSGYVSRDDAAFPTLVYFGGGEMICGYTAKGKGPEALGGTDWSRSTDYGSTWIYEGTILPRTENPVTVNNLRLSGIADGTIVAYGGRDHIKGAGDSRTFGKDMTNEPVFCISSDRGKTWSRPSAIPVDPDSRFEISNPVIDPGNGVLLAPAATLPEESRLGERVLLYRSPDQGSTWPECSTVFYDEEGAKGFFEQKIISLGEGRLLAVAWTVTLGDYRDLENHFSISTDYGKTWSKARSTGIKVQTLSPLYLGGNRLMLLGNRRYGNQGVVCFFVRFTDKEWIVEGESLLWDARSTRKRGSEKKTGIDAFDDFAFGLPSAVKLEDSSFYSVHWCREDGIFGIRWTRFREVPA